MREIGAFEAKNTLGSLLDEVERGGEVVITRRGKRVARLVPELPVKDPAAARAAMERIRARLRGAAPLTIEEIIQFRDEGRR